MKKLFLKSISICLALIFVFSMIIIPDVVAETEVILDEKIDSHLAEKLSEMDSDDTVHVSVWFDDIDHDSVKEKTRERFTNTKSRSSSDTSAIKILDSDVNTEIANDFRDDSCVDDVQEIIEIKRKISANEYVVHNSQLKEKMVQDLLVDEDNILYVSALAPNIEAVLTKGQVYELASNDMVTCVYVVEEASSTVEITEEQNISVASSSDTYTQHQYTMTGLNTMRDAFGFDGTGVNIGVFDVSYLNEDYLEEHYDTTIETYSYPSFEDSGLDTDNHTYNILTLISGYVENGTKVFEGGAPGANIYIANENTDYYSSNWKSCLEWLMVVKNCNVINMSRYLDNDLQYEYGVNAKWIDHIATFHNVHFVIASGNQSQFGDKNSIMDSTMAYNAIAVGSVDTDGKIYVDSCYSVANFRAYKPELVAPGTEIKLPSSNGEAIRGTSFAAPLVTCAVAQLCQASATLRYNPSLMKAVLMSGAKRNAYMVSEIPLSVEDETTISLAHNYGVGLLYVPNCYTSFVTNEYFKTGTMLPTNTNVTKTVNINRTNKLFRVVAAWDKTVTLGDSHLDNIVAENAEVLDKFQLKVTTPSGKTYSSYYPYDNKQVVAFVTQETGTYTITLVRNSTENSGKSIEYGISWSLLTAIEEDCK